MSPTIFIVWARAYSYSPVAGFCCRSNENNVVCTGQADFEAMVKEEFGKLMATGGVTPNEAAVEALKIATAKVKCKA
eukprot:scaffold89391_cov16-Prasinocladus_malaysianus.AAC.3